jgi:hypothetical protein
MFEIDLATQKAVVRRTLATRGVLGALALLNDRTAYRYSGIYKLGENAMRAVHIFDRHAEYRAWPMVLPLSQSFCQHVMQQGETVISHASTDRRFALLPHAGPGRVVLWTTADARMRNAVWAPSSISTWRRGRLRHVKFLFFTRWCRISCTIWIDAAAAGPECGGFARRAVSSLPYRLPGASSMRISATRHPPPEGGKGSFPCGPPAQARWRGTPLERARRVAALARSGDQVSQRAQAARREKCVDGQPTGLIALDPQHPGTHQISLRGSPGGVVQGEASRRAGSHGVRSAGASAASSSARDSRSSSACSSSST